MSKLSKLITKIKFNNFIPRVSEQPRAPEPV